MNSTCALKKTGVEKANVPSCNQFEFVEPSFQDWLISLGTLKKFSTTGSMLNEMQDFLFHFFSTSENPYISVLKAMRHCGDFNSGKNDSLALDIIKCFSKWIVAEKNLTVHTCLNDSVKLYAFNLVNEQNNKSLISEVIKTYKLVDSKLIFVDLIKKMVSQYKYKEACQNAILLKLFDEFDIKDFVIPLIIENKFNIAENYINSRRKHQLDLVTFLDKILDKQNYSKNLLLSLINMNINGVDQITFPQRACSKLIQRLIKADKTLSFACPNYFFLKNVGTVTFLINKRFVEKKIGLESWEELIMDVVGSNENLQILVVSSVFRYKHPDEAIMWARKFQIPVSKWSKKWKQMSVNYGKKSFQELVAEEKMNQGIKYHNLCIPRSNIHIIDTKSSLNEFLDKVVPTIKLIGLDCEWKPAFGIETNNVSLLQVATHSHVYILDIKALCEKNTSDVEWANLGKNLLFNPDILKLGFDIKSDFAQLEETISEMKKFHVEKNNYLDLKCLWKDLVENHKFQFPFRLFSESSYNLSTLVELCIGNKLDKSDQLSNWEKRPLRESQIIYAALDAYCLIEVYTTLYLECKRQNIYLTEFDKCPLVETTTQNISGISKIKNKKKKKKKKVTGPSNSFPLLQYKIVCGPMLMALGKQLRLLGLNTVILEKDPPENVFNSKEGPTILFTQTRKIRNIQRYNKVFRIYPKKLEKQVLDVLSCLEIKSVKYINFRSSRCEVRNKVNLVFLSVSLRLSAGFRNGYFVVKIFKAFPVLTERFSFQECNSNSFITFDKSEIKNISNSTISEVFNQKISDKFKNLEFRIEKLNFALYLEFFNFNYPCSIPFSEPLVLGKQVILFSVITYLIKVSVCNPNINVFYVCENCLSCYWDEKRKKKGLMGFRGKPVNIPILNEMLF